MSTGSGTVHDLAAIIGSSDAELRAEACRLLTDRLREHGAAAIDEAIARALLIPLGSASRSEQRVIADLVAPLVARAPELHTVLREALTAADARLRWGCAYTLGRALPPGPELWPVARETMRLDDGDQRWAAADLACRVLRDHPALRDEMHGALADPSSTLRKMILYCLRDLSDADLARTATEMLADADAGVRLAAIAALSVAAATGASTPDRERAAHAMAQLLDADPDSGVRRAAAATLGKIGIADATVRSALVTATRGRDTSLARAATGALRALGVAG